MAGHVALAARGAGAAATGRGATWRLYPAAISHLARANGQELCSAAEKEAGGGHVADSEWRHPVGIAFDIDGVLLRGKRPIQGAREALLRLFGRGDAHSSRPFPLPHVYLTNGGGVTEAAKAAELSALLGVPVTSEQVLLGHTPFKALASRYREKPVLAVGKYDPKSVLENYGFKAVFSIDEYVLKFPNIDPLAPYKPWMHSSITDDAPTEHRTDIDPIAAVFVVSDPVDWGREIQVLCDVLRSGGCPGLTSGEQPDLFFAADDLEYQAKFPVPRFGMGAFRVALQTLFEKLTGEELKYTVVGKPLPSAFQGAELALTRLADRIRAGGEVSRSAPHMENGPDRRSAECGTDPTDSVAHNGSMNKRRNFRRLYMVGDNPATDIRGALEAGPPWVAILTRTGVHTQSDNHPVFPAHKVVDSIEGAIDFIAKQEQLP